MSLGGALGLVRGVFALLAARPPRCRATDLGQQLRVPARVLEVLQALVESLHSGTALGPFARQHQVGGEGIGHELGVRCQAGGVFCAEISP